MNVNNGGFFAGIDGFLEDADKDAVTNTRKVLFSAWQGLTDQSPVDQGTFKGNWMMTVNGLSAETSEKVGAQPFPDVAFKMGDAIFLSNALPYALRIESGWSPMAPQGVVGPTRRALILELQKND